MRYREYKKVDLPWLDEVPSHWEINRAKYFIYSKKEINKDKKIMNVLSLTLNGVIRNDSENPIGLSPGDYSTYQIFNNNDLVFKLIDLNNIRTSRVGLVNEIGIMSSAYIRGIIDNSILYPKYIYYWYYKLYLEEVYNKLGSGVRSTLSSNELLEMEVPIPPKDEQEQIARFLDWKINEIDRLIQQKKKKVELIETAYNKILNNNFNIFNDGKETKIKFKNFAKLQNGISGSDDFFTDGDPFVSYSAVYNNLFLPTKIRDKAKSSKSQQEQFSVVEGDIFITRTSERVSDAFMVSLCEKTIEKSTFSGFLIRARIFKENIIPKFLLFYLTTDEIREELLKNLNLVTRVSISQELIKNLSFAIPTLEYQKEIIRKCEKITKQKNSLKNNISLQINILEQLKQSLISDVVTGKIDVRNISIPEYDKVSDIEDDVILEESFNEEV